MFTIVYEVNCNFFIALPIQLKIDRSNDFLFYTRQNVLAQKIGRALEALRARARPIPIVQACNILIMFTYLVKTNLSTYGVKNNCLPALK